VFNTYDIERCIKKQDKFVSLWLPPTSYPQFFTYLTYGKVKLINASQRAVVIDKLYIPRYINPSRMFQPLMTFLRRHLNQPINILEIRTTK
jgi:hypothetical protein